MSAKDEIKNVKDNNNGDLAWQHPSPMIAPQGTIDRPSPLVWGRRHQA